MDKTSVSAFIFSSHEESFEKAVEESKVLKQRPDNDELSGLYGLYKQATVGDVNIGEFFQGVFIIFYFFLTLSS